MKMVRHCKTCGGEIPGVYDARRSYCDNPKCQPKPIQKRNALRKQPTKDDIIL